MTPVEKLSIVVPCHNEAGNLAHLVFALREVMEPIEAGYEIIVVDDFSRDHSWEVLKLLGAQDSRVRALRLARNYGQSAALWAGFQAARGEYIATLDADLQNDPQDLPRFLEAARHSDCVCGSRVLSRAGGDGLVRRLSSKIANQVRNCVMQENVSDAGCCYRVFRRECVRNLKFFKGMHRFLPTLFRLEGYGVTEIPVSHRTRFTGRSHYNIWNRVFTSSHDLLAVWWMKRRTLLYRIEEGIGCSPGGFAEPESAGGSFGSELAGIPGESNLRGTTNGARSTSAEEAWPQPLEGNPGAGDVSGEVRISESSGKVHVSGI